MSGLVGYASAAELFEAVRDASREAERARLAIMQMEAREGVRAQGYESRARSGSGPDRTTATDSRIDLEERMRRRLDDDYALIDLACRLLYGEESGKGGVDALMGSAVADCICYRYVQARTWSRVSELMGYSASQCKRLCRQGMDAMDFYGLDNVLAGVGTAEG